MKALVALVAAVVVCASSACGPGNSASAPGASNDQNSTTGTSSGTVAPSSTASGSGTVGASQQTLPPLPPGDWTPPPVTLPPAPGDGAPPVTTPPGPKAVAYAFAPVTCPGFFGRTIGFAGVAIFASEQLPADACTVATTCNLAKNTSSAMIYVVSYNSSGAAAPVGEGTYQVGGMPSLAGGTYASATLAKTDASCVYEATSASSGQVVIKSLAADQITGSYDLTFGDGQTVSGTFAAANCSTSLSLGDVCNTYSPSTAMAACQGTTTCQ